MKQPPAQDSSHKTNRLFPLAMLMIALACVGLSSCAKTGQRIIHFEVKVDDKIALTGKRGIMDTKPIEEIWNVAPDVLFEMSKSYLDSAGAPLEGSQTHEVKGNLVFRVRHVNQELAVSSITSLKFKKANADSWSLSDGEVDLLKQASETKK